MDLLFRDQEMLYSWTGANPETFESAILKFRGDGPDADEGDVASSEGV